MKVVAPALCRQRKMRAHQGDFQNIYIAAGIQAKITIKFDMVVTGSHHRRIIAGREFNLIAGRECLS